MSQILRLSSSNICKSQLNTIFTDAASETIAQLYGCRNCRILRSKRHEIERQGYSFIPRRKSFSSAQTKEEEGPLIIISQNGPKSVEKQLQTYEKVLRTSIVQSIYNEEKKPDRKPWPDQPSYETIKKSQIFTNQVENEKSKTIHKFEEIKRKGIKWGAQLKRFKRQFKNVKPTHVISKPEVDQEKVKPKTRKSIKSAQSGKPQNLDKMKLISDSAHDQMKVENLDFDSRKNVSTAKSGQTKVTVIKDKKTNQLPSKEIETTENITKKKEKKYIKQWKRGMADEKPVTYTEDVERKNIHFNHDFKAFVDACLFTDKAEAAYLALRYYRFNNLDGNGQDNYRQITDITSYSSMLHHYAKTGNVSRMADIFSCMKELKVKPNLQCYAAFLECLGRQETVDYQRGKEILHEITSEGYDIRNVFNECAMMKDERSVISLVLNQLIDNFEPLPPPEQRPYTGPLLEPLNEPRDFSKVQEKNPYSGVVTSNHIVNQLKTQLGRESDDCIHVSTIQKKLPLTEQDLEMKQKLEELKESWRKSLHHAFKTKLKSLHQNERDKDGMKMAPFLKLFEPREYVDLLMMEIEHLSSTSAHYSPSCSTLWLRLGRRVYNRYIVKYKKQAGIIDKIEKVYTDFVKVYNDPDAEIRNYREGWKDLCHQHKDGPTIDLHMKSWSYFLQRSVGKTLYDLIMNELKIDTSLTSSPEEKRRTVPAFYYVYRSLDYTRKAQLKPHPVLIKLFTGNYIKHITFETRELPMLVPPIPWYSSHKGGFILNETKITRAEDSLIDDLIESVPSHQINSVYDALNVLDMCAWKINKPMLKVIIEMFNNKGNKDLDIPPPISECPPLPEITLDMSAEQKKKIRKERASLKQYKQEMYSLWCNELYKLSIAYKFKDDVFWFPHNLDFRGRTYPCPPHFNHLGGDVTRSILYFAKGKPLGEKGLDWLKIHLVNLTGFKKRCSNKERLAYADEMLPEILDSADNPIHGRKWWQACDEPWQSLAACKEIAKAVRSPNPVKYICRFPVHQDGSCNGLQHYAALGRDQAGAESVNLCPFESPKDVYSDVAELVEEVRSEDAAEGNEIAQALEGFIRRKVIKQTVMTTVYGVTKYGARYQILKQLKDIPEFPEKYQWKASIYLTETVFKCLDKMFTSSKQIQNWFIESSDLISGVCKKPVEWVTPLGLPVLQPYFMKKSIHMPGVNVVQSEQSLHEKPNTRKQKNGFPPNYIHSLDSVHMMLTALYCWRAGITYVSVHDCYWTHPCDVDIMNKICRDQFVALHSQPILEDLSNFFQVKYGQLPKNEVNRVILDSVFRNVPERGTFDLDKVKKSTYFFS